MRAVALGLLLVTGYAQAGTTASGTLTREGVAACPPDMPFGTRLSVEDVGEVLCEDRYAAGLSRRVDVWLPSVEQCYAVTGLHQVSLLEADEVD